MKHRVLRVPARAAQWLRASRRRWRATRWRRRSPNFLIVFNWHQDTPVFDPERHHPGTWTSVEALAAELDDLAAEFQIVALPQALERLEHGRLRGPCVALTFDDGDPSHATDVLPLLR